MTQRAYTLDEIDRMRSDLGRRLNSPPFGGMVSSATIEDRLRTYMMGGVDPAELKAKADEREAEITRLCRPLEITAP